MGKHSSKQAQQDYEGTPVEGSSALDAAIGETSRQDNLALAQIRMEHESIVTQARMVPRSFAKMKAEAQEMLDAFPEFASEAIYVKPVGTVLLKDCTKCKKENEYSYIPNSGIVECTHCGTEMRDVKKWDCVKRKKYATGLSIRAAEVCAELYKYNQVSSRVVPVDEDHVSVEALFIDYQNGRKWSDAGILSTVYTDQFKQKKKINEDRFYNLICKAQASIRIREVILRCVNPAFKAWLEATCREKQRTLLTDEKVAAIVAQFAGKGVTLEMLVKYIGRTQKEGWTVTDRERLVGAWTAINQGDSTVKEIFADDDDEPGAAGNGAGKTSEKPKDLAALAKKAKGSDGGKSTADDDNKEAQTGKGGTAVSDTNGGTTGGKKAPSEPEKPAETAKPATKQDPGPATSTSTPVGPEEEEDDDEDDDTGPTDEEKLQIAEIKKQLLECTTVAQAHGVFDGWAKLGMREPMKQFLQMQCIKRELALCEYKEDVHQVFQGWAKIKTTDQIKTLVINLCDEFDAKLVKRPPPAEKVTEPATTTTAPTEAKKKKPKQPRIFGEDE